MRRVAVARSSVRGPRAQAAPPAPQAERWRGQGAGPPRAGARPGSRSLRDQGRDDDEALGLRALAVGLDLGPVLEVVVDDLPLRRAHRLELGRAAGLDRPLSRHFRLAVEGLGAAVSVAGRVNDHALALGVATERDP